MKDQTPAEGVLIHRSYGDAMRFNVACECGCGDSDHDVWVEAEAGSITVEIATTQSTDCWGETFKPRYDIDNEFLQHTDWFVKRLVNGLIRKLKLTKDIWFTGRITYTAAIMMTEQQALNYSATLAKSVTAAKNFRSSKN